MSRTNELDQCVETVAAMRDLGKKIATQLEGWVNDLQSGMYINCVYCGHRYGPNAEVPASMADVLKEHIEQCSAHPLSEAKRRVEELEQWVNNSGLLYIRKETHEAKIVKLEAKIQYLVDSWPNRLEDDCVSFPDGSSWSKS